MSIATSTQKILDDAHSLVSSDVVYRKLISSMRFHKEKRLWFSEREFSFNLVAGKSSYAPGDGLPIDCVEIVGSNIWVLISGSDDQRQVCIRVPTSEYEYQRQTGASESQPDIWDYFGNKLRFNPTPISSTDLANGRYVTDIGVPVVKYESGAYVFYAPDGLRALNATEIAEFDNDWLDPQGAGPMIEARAAHLLYKEYLKDPDHAQEWLSTWLEYVGLLEGETEARTAGATEIVGSILD